MILFSIIRYISKKISVITRQERRRLVLEPCNEGKTKHEIAKDARISFGDIGVILNKAVEEKRTEGSKEEQDNNIVGKNDQKKNAYIYPPGLQTLF